MLRLSTPLHTLCRQNRRRHTYQSERKKSLAQHSHLAFSAPLPPQLLLYRTESLSSSLAGEGNSTLITSLQLSTLALFFFVAACCEAVTTGSLDAAHVPTVAEASAFAQALPWRDILWTGLISTAGTLWIEVEALRSVSSTDAALVYTTEPVWGAVLSWALLGEILTGSSYAGAALILCGSIIGQTGGGGGHGGDHGEGQGGEAAAKEKAA